MKVKSDAMRERADALIARMPKLVRDEVARLREEVVRLEAALKQRGESDSLVNIRQTQLDFGGYVYEPLENEVVLVFGDVQSRTTCGIEVKLERVSDAGEPMLHIRNTGIGSVSVMPVNSGALQVKASTGWNDDAKFNIKPSDWKAKKS